MSRIPASRRAFTLLEVIVALGILALGLMVLVDTQSTAVMMTIDMDRTTTATMLAQEKLSEAIITLESEGWTSQDIEEQGDFDNFGDEEFRGDSLHLDLGPELDDFKYAYTVRKIDLSLPADVWGAAGDLASNGFWGDDAAEKQSTSETEAPFDLSTLGISTEMITDYLADYVREVRVIVWWGENDDKTDQVELVHHVINPSGIVTEAEDDQ